VTLSHSLENMDFLSVSGYRSEDSYNLEDNDRAPERSADVSSEQESWTFSQEFRLVSTAESDPSWTAGVYYFHDDGDRDQIRYSDFFGPGGLVGPGSPEIQNSTTTFQQRLETDAWAVFGELQYYVTERASVTLGARYSDEKKDFDLTGFAVANPGSASDYSLFLPQGAYSTSVSESGDAFTPKIVLAYELSEDVNAYLSYTEGFKSGGYNGQADTAADVIPFDPEEVTQYEFGLKGRFLEGRLSANFAAFYIDFEDLQLQGFDPVTGSPITANAAQAEIQGLEFEFSALIGENFNINFGASYLDHQFEEYAIEVFDPTIQGGPPFRLVDKSGERLGLIPDYNAFLGLSYRWPMREGASLTVTADAVAVDDTITVFDTLWSDSYEVYNLRATWRPASGRWDAALWVENLTDEDYYRGGGPVPDLNDQISRLGLVADPRIIGMSLNWRFGEF